MKLRGAHGEREFDLIEFRDGDKRVKLIECKDWSRRVGISTVEAFVSKCDDHYEVEGTTRGAMISQSGFTDSAKDKAEAHGVQLYTLKDSADVAGETWPATGVLITQLRNMDINPYLYLRGGKGFALNSNSLCYFRDMSWLDILRDGLMWRGQRIEARGDVLSCRPTGDRWTRDADGNRI